MEDKTMKRRAFSKAALGTVVGAALGGGSMGRLILPAQAAGSDLEPGFKINAANLDQVMSRTFEGKTIRSMLTDILEMQIRKYNLQITLRASEAIPLDQRYLDWTAKNRSSGKIAYDPTTRLVSGWEAGVPFPDVDEKDPNAATKLMWNYFYAAPLGQSQFNEFAFLFIDGKSGIERVQKWRYLRFFMKGRWGDQNKKLMYGDGSELHHTLLFATYPFDLKGVGTYTVRYDSPKYDDSWVYLRGVRRTRRLSGGSWMDPIGGTDQLQDDIAVFNANPTWYPNFKLLGKRTVLAIAHMKWPCWNVNGKDTAEQFPALDSSQAPFWNPNENWEPREVWVIEATTPPDHPYSKKILYMETKHPNLYFAEAYDRKGEFWKFINFGSLPLVGADGSKTVPQMAGYTVDFQRNHSTVFFASPDSKTNTLDPPEAVTLGVLEKEGGS